MNQTGYLTCEPLTFRKRVSRLLFPSGALAADSTPRFEGCADGEAHTVMRIRLSWVDRLRLVVSGAAQVEIRHRTDVEVRKMVSLGVFYALPPGSKV